jgi:hypothetical protein
MELLPLKRDHCARAASYVRPYASSAQIVRAIFADSNDVRWTPGQHLAQSLRQVPCAHDDRSRTVDQQCSQIHVAALMPPSRTLPPVPLCRGTNPRNAANSRPDLNAPGSPIVATRAVAVSGPIPGFRHRPTSSFLALPRCQPLFKLADFAVELTNMLQLFTQRIEQHSRNCLLNFVDPLTDLRQAGPATRLEGYAKRRRLSPALRFTARNNDPSTGIENELSSGGLSIEKESRRRLSPALRFTN